MRDLNIQQKEAVEIMNGQALILSAAGTGKTTVLVERFLYLIENGVNPYNILCVTFTNKAANEMTSRILSKVSQHKNLWIGTFHSICFRLLTLSGVFNGNIIDDYDYLKPNYEDSLDHIKNLEDVISQLYGVLEYIINSKGDIQEMEVEDIIPSIKSVFKEDEIIQLERNVKLDELVKNFTPCDKISRTTSPDIDITIGVNGKRKTKFTVTKLFYFFCFIISMICFSCCYILIYFNSFSFG